MSMLVKRNQVFEESLDGKYKLHPSWRVGECIEMMDFKRGCCGAVFILTLIVGCLAINIIPNL
jgi:hypothetical protein